VCSSNKYWCVELHIYYRVPLEYSIIVTTGVYVPVSVYDFGLPLTLFQVDFARDSLCGNRVTEDQEDPRLTGKTHVLDSTYYIHFNATYNDEQKSSYSDYIQLSHAVTA
jgi:hypothetical protein